jgi:PD-(D/E)XK endonuclease
MLSTDQKGGIAELAIALAAARLGIDVYRPLQEGGRYDLIFGAGGALARVQCKWANRYDDVIVVRAYRCRRTAAGLLQRGYSVDEIDAVAAYCSELDTCYFIPLESVSGQKVIQLRLEAARNNQRRKIRWAKDFEFAAKLPQQVGAVAQLGERLAGSQKVTGSSPVGSTLLT